MRIDETGGYASWTILLRNLDSVFWVILCIQEWNFRCYSLSMKAEENAIGSGVLL